MENTKKSGMMNSANF